MARRARHVATGAISADQEVFFDELLNLEQYHMTNCNPCVLPMAVGADLASLPLPQTMNVGKKHRTKVGREGV